MMANEEWRVIKGFPDYAVSESGRVKRITPCRAGCGHLLTPAVEVRGSYKRIKYSLQSRDEYKSCVRLAHQLVCEAFHGPKPAHCTGVRHLDGNALNNHFSNLAWGTQAQNMADMAAHGTGAFGERHGHAKITNDAAIKIAGRGYRRWSDVEAMAAEYNVTATAIYKIIKGARFSKITGVKPRRAAALWHTRGLPESEALL
jgi:hypothetical protein